MDPAFDRGEIDRASLDATERLRARLSSRSAAPPKPPRSVLPWVVVSGLFVFIVGMIANPWFEGAIRARLPLAAGPRVAGVEVNSEVGSPAVGGALPAGERLARTEAQIETSVDQLARDAARIDKLTGEVAALTARIDSEAGRSEAASVKAVAAADRAQGMIAVLLARQAIEAGRPLGSIDYVLKQSFEARHPAAVGSISALGIAPVTLMALQRDFARLNPATTGVQLDWWQTLTSTLQNLVSRPVDTAQSANDAAARALARGDVAAAANHLRRLPPPRPPAVMAWLAAADRLQAGHAALATLEAAAITLPMPTTAVESKVSD